MIWGIEGRHMWIPPQFGRVNLARSPRGGAGGISAWTDEGLLLFEGIDLDGLGIPRPLPGHDRGFMFWGNDVGDHARTLIDVVAGKTYRFSAYVYPGASFANRVQVAVHNGAGGQEAISATPTPAEAWTRLNTSFVADETARWQFRVKVVGAGDFQGAFTAVLVERSASLGTYFDGATSQAKWLGQPDGSESATGIRAASIEDVGTPLFPPSLSFRRTDDNGEAIFPRHKLRKIGGLMSLGDSMDNRDGRVGAEGEIPRRSFRRGKTVTYEGLTQARDRRELREAEAAMRQAFADQSVEGMVVVTPHPLYDDSGDYRYFPAKALACEIPDEPVFHPGRVDTRGHESSFVVGVRTARAGGFSYFDQDGVGYA